MGDNELMRIGYYTSSGLIWGYGDESMVPSNVIPDTSVITDWSGVTPEPLSNYKVVNNQVVLRTQTDKDDAQWKHIRQERNKKLSSTDWTHISDNGLTSSKKTEFATYRQSLRDITTQSDPFNITWPTEPTHT